MILWWIFISIFVYKLENRTIYAEIKKKYHIFPNASSFPQTKITIFEILLLEIGNNYTNFLYFWRIFLYKKKLPNFWDLFFWYHLKQLKNTIQKYKAQKTKYSNSKKMSTLLNAYTFFKMCDIMADKSLNVSQKTLQLMFLGISYDYAWTLWNNRQMMLMYQQMYASMYFQYCGYRPICFIPFWG